MAVIALWRFNPVTGYWKHERNVTDETAKQWLRVFQDDEPSAHFAIAKSRPNKSPVNNPTNSGGVGEGGRTVAVTKTYVEQVHKLDQQFLRDAISAFPAEARRRIRVIKDAGVKSIGMIHLEGTTRSDIDWEGYVILSLLRDGRKINIEVGARTPAEPKLSTTKGYVVEEKEFWIGEVTPKILSPWLRARLPVGDHS